MTIISLRHMPSKLQEAIRRRAGKDGLSLNKTVHELHHDLDHLAGTWSDQEAADFDATLLEQRTVDPKSSQENPGGVTA